MLQKRPAIDIEQGLIVENNHTVGYSVFCVIYFGKYLEHFRQGYLVASHFLNSDC